MKDDKETKYSFLALFENTLHTTSNKIVWLDSNKKQRAFYSITIYYVLCYRGGYEYP